MPACVIKRVDRLNGVLVGPFVGHCSVMLGCEPFADGASVFSGLKRVSAIGSLRTVDGALLEKFLSELGSFNLTIDAGII